MPAAVVQVRQQFHHGPPTGAGGGDRLDPCLALGQPLLVLPDELAQLPVPADLAGSGIEDHHLTRPDGLQDADITGVQRREVLPDGVIQAGSARLPARQFHRAVELRKPRHRTQRFPRPRAALTGPPCCHILTPGDTSRKAQPPSSGRWIPAPQEAVRAFRQHKQHTDAMPKSITIRDVPDATSEELAARAALTGRSLQEYLRTLLVDIAGRPDAEAWVAKVRARKDATGSAISVEQVLALRDADRE